MAVASDRTKSRGLPRWPRSHGGRRHPRGTHRTPRWRRGGPQRGSRTTTGISRPLVAPVELVAGERVDEARPEPLALLGGRDASLNVANLGADLDRRVGIRHQVVEPGGVGRLARLGGDHDDRVAVLVVHQRRAASGTALGAGVVEHEDARLGPAGHAAAKPAAAAPVEGDVEPGRAPAQVQAALAGEFRSRGGKASQQSHFAHSTGQPRRPLRDLRCPRTPSRPLLARALRARLATDD